MKITIEYDSTGVAVVSTDSGCSPQELVGMLVGAIHGVLTSMQISTLNLSGVPTTMRPELQDIINKVVETVRKIRQGEEGEGNAEYDGGSH